MSSLRNKLLLIVALVAGGAGLAGALLHGRPGPAPAAASLDTAVTTATVTRQTLLDTFQATGTVGYSGTYAVLNQYSPPASAATLTQLQDAINAAQQNLADVQAAINVNNQQDANAISADQSQLASDQQSLNTAKAQNNTTAITTSTTAVANDQKQLTTDQNKQQTDHVANQAKLHAAQQAVTTAQDNYNKTVTPGGGGGSSQGGGGGSSGVYTALAAAGQTISRGQTVYAVNGRPIPLFYGSVPLARQLTTGVSGDDVKELEDNLVALGYGSGLTDDGNFKSADATAVKRWQAALGVSQTGVVDPGEAVVLPGALRVSAVKVSLNASTQSGADVIDGTSPNHVVSVALDARQQTMAQVGAACRVVLPDSSSVNGKITDVGTVATTTGTGASQTTTVPVTVVLADDSRAGKLDAASVTVNITRTSRQNVLTVPIAALLALPGGGYAVETASTHRRIPVQTGIYSNGLVEISGSGLVEGMQVVAPSL
ncbi:MAG TPA: peptidoglycan-binding protein [Candidatus Dormibacteraeota bacterium]